MIRMIIVDDEVLSRIGIQSFIEGKEAYSVEGVFGRAKDAVAFLEREPVDIVITDIEMADMNGLELIQTIRNKKLADGIIIISCHDNFDYAREAIALGTDSYMLKHDIDEKKLCNEVEKVYQKVTARRGSETSSVLERQSGRKVEEDGAYYLGVLKILDPKSGQTLGKEQTEETMVVHLLEEIVNKYHMGTLFAPYKKEFFIIFRFEHEMQEAECRKAIEEYAWELQNNMAQYINKSVIVGVSGRFDLLQETRDRYEEALQLAEMSFYYNSKTVFFCGQINTEAAPPDLYFTWPGMLEEHGLSILEKELTAFLVHCRKEMVNVGYLKETLIRCMYELVYRALSQYEFSIELKKKWNQYEMVTEIISADNMNELKKKLLLLIKRFRADLLDEVNSDDFQEIFVYIQENLAEQISLKEIAERKCMSVPYFCKKFKERTGMTFVQYVNQKRIEKAKHYLRNTQYSLGQAAELSGFSNENYMVRVFKKVTGQTITDYRAETAPEDIE